jgi:hypothetical protein
VGSLIEQNIEHTRINRTNISGADVAQQMRDTFAT